MAETYAVGPAGDALCCGVPAPSSS